MARKILTAVDGQVFGDRVAIGDSFLIQKSGRLRPVVKLRCKCGSEGIVDVRRAATTRCRKCINADRREDITGRHFGSWTVIEFVGLKVFPSGQTQAQWLVSCDCGRTKKVGGSLL